MIVDTTKRSKRPRSDHAQADRIPLVRTLAGGARLSDADGAEALVQTIELAEAAEEIGIHGAYLRVHHFARHWHCCSRCWRRWSPHSRLEIGTALIHMRYEYPLYMAKPSANKPRIAPMATTRPPWLWPRMKRGIAGSASRDRTI